MNCSCSSPLGIGKSVRCYKVAGLVQFGVYPESQPVLPPKSGNLNVDICSKYMKTHFDIRNPLENIN